MDRKVLKWNFIFQYGWVLTNIFNSILLLPLYLKNIDKDTLGIWLATGNILTWMTLVDPGVGEVLQQRIAELRGKQDNTEVAKTIGSGLLSSTFILLISLIVGFIFYFLIGVIIDKNVSQYPHLSTALIISVIATGMSLVSFGVSGINQGLHNSAPVAISSLTANFLFLFLNVLCLYAGFGVLSIAIANLCRAVYLNLFNIISVRRVMRKLNMTIIFDNRHLRSFIKIFSFTSVSKIITGLSYSMEMIVLARYISPAMITMYEINKRPINITYSLIGRHSVALMPLISHAKGKGDKQSILDLINKQFRFYSYAAFLASFLFLFNYEYLITTWTGEGQYAGNLIVYLLISSFILNLISYFMAIVGYALGDIKMNSQYNIIRNIIFGILMFVAARYFGIIGTVTLAVAITLIADLFFYGYRLYKLGYFDTGLVKNLARQWLVIIPISFLAGWIFRSIISSLIPANMHFALLLINGGIFTLFFIILVLIVDEALRRKSRQLANKYVVAPISRLKRA